MYTNNSLITTTYILEESVEFTSYNSKKTIGYINITNEDIFSKTMELNNHFICNLNATNYLGYKVELEVPKENNPQLNNNYYYNSYSQIYIDSKESVLIPITLRFNSYQENYSVEYTLFQKDLKKTFRPQDCYRTNDDGTLGKIIVNADIKHLELIPEIDYYKKDEIVPNTARIASTIIQTYNFSNIHDLISNQNNELIAIDAINNISYDFQCYKLISSTLYITKKIENNITKKYFNDEETQALKNITFNLKGHYNLYFDKQNNIYVLVQGRYLYKKDKNNFNLILASPDYKNGITDSIFDIAFDNNNQMYFATQYRLLRYNDSKSQIKSKFDVLHDSYLEDNIAYRNIVIDNNNNIFASSYNQLFKYENKNLSPISGASKYPYINYVYKALLKDASIKGISDMEIDKNNNIYFISD
ncbi:MAG: hypothetical protein KC589_11330, partial [Nanoarchaeota archaeon]|nr:hypothetical protein [Nanoarchaeota archaeon]